MAVKLRFKGSTEESYCTLSSSQLSTERAVPPQPDASGSSFLVSSKLFYFWSCASTLSRHCTGGCTRELRFRPRRAGKPSDESSGPIDPTYGRAASSGHAVMPVVM
eukprot:1191555-Prorocentrum_minimum.AAC.9